MDRKVISERAIGKHPTFVLASYEPNVTVIHFTNVKAYTPDIYFSRSYGAE